MITEAQRLTSRLFERAYTAQIDRFDQLTDSGWRLRAYEINDWDWLLIDGLTDVGEPFRGYIDREGNVTGEPIQDGTVPEWIAAERAQLAARATSGGVRPMSAREHAIQRDRVRLAIELDPDRGSTHGRPRPARRTRIAGPMLDDLNALFAA